MGLIKSIKGKYKKYEVRNREKDENFEFEKEYVFNENYIQNKFEFIYCNNYTEKLSTENNLQLSLISCKITLEKNIKNLEYLSNFINLYHAFNIKEENYFKYRNFVYEIKNKEIFIFLKGDILFYRAISDIIPNNIITKYINTNIFPNGLHIETPNEFINNLYFSIINPNKDIDILFIEDKFDKEFKYYDPVIGLSINDKLNILPDEPWLNINHRNIIYIELYKLSKDNIDLIFKNINNSDLYNKLLNTLHKDIEKEDIDEVIE